MTFIEQLWYLLKPGTSRKNYDGWGKTGLSLLYKDVEARKETIEAMKNWRYETAMSEDQRKSESSRGEYWPDRLEAWKKANGKGTSKASSEPKENSLRHHQPSQRRRKMAA